MTDQRDISNLELWGGVEATVNRVENKYFDQLEKSGHATRPSDLDLLATLGVTSLRYPVLWERTAPNGFENIDWSWSDERLAKLRTLKINPIVGLVHHGSGPQHTSLLDDSFVEGVEKFAGLVAERYPWVEYYTPVNEPLTTARFSCLYAVWYPHKKDPSLFVKALLNECKAIVLAMQAIRKVKPNAKLVQTEDLGKVYGIPELQDQVEFDNERRWITFDLLCGKVDQQHRMWKYLTDHGISEAEINFFLQHPCPPDVFGINYYVTSERFLDTRIDRYPVGSICSNGVCEYADVEAVRVQADDLAGPYNILKEAWERYHQPLAITEAHIGCTREEQLRWLKEFWEAGTKLRSEGVDVRAITVWALMGVFDWDSLVTLDRGHYEPGAFDVRGNPPRPTAIATMMRNLSSQYTFSHDIFSAEGWWRRANRHTYEPTPHYEHKDQQVITVTEAKLTQHRPLIILGGTGTLGQAFAKACDIRGLEYQLLGRKDLDVTDEKSITQALQERSPWAVVNATGYVRIDDAEKECDICYAVNTEGPATLAKTCELQGIPCVTFSSDMVFDGQKKAPYIESDKTNPLNVYGKSKAQAEQEILAATSNSLIVRTSSFFGPDDQFNFATNVVRSLQKGEPFEASAEHIISPTYLPHLTNTVLDLLIDNETGIWHLTNKAEISWFDFALLVARKKGLPTALITHQASPEFAAQRPKYSVLGSERAQLLPSIEEAVAEYLGALKG